MSAVSERRVADLGTAATALVPGLAGSQLTALGERVRSSVAATPFAAGPGRLLAVTVSVGCASGTLGALGALIEAADGALYEAKHAGRNRVSLAH